MRLLVISEAYPCIDNLYAASFVHTRCVEYLKKGVELVVLSFSASHSYTFEGVEVNTETDFLKCGFDFELIMSHAPNLKNHVRLLNQVRFSNQPLIVYFHGHEIMDTAKYYPKAFEFDKKNKIKKIIQYLYDPVKLFLMKKFLKKVIQRRNVKLIFVSEWMQEIAFESMKLTYKDTIRFKENSLIIFNGVNDYFLKNKYVPDFKLLADFVTIRPFDNSKYAIDLVYKLAKENPQKTFHIYGMGKFFDYVPSLSNLTIFQKYIAQKDIPGLLNKYKAAMMPTRLDAQGVMMCEIAVFGMPLLTSDISICHEMLGEFSNVAYLSNNLAKDVNLDSLLKSLVYKNDVNTNTKFDIQFLCEQELSVAVEMLKKRH
jgi:glycosyltransferase involved in cell wall biosynthesis